MNSDHKLRLLIISSGLHVIGGLEKIITSLANFLSEKNYDITLLIIDRSSLVFYLLNENIKIESLIANFGIGNEYRYIKRKFSFIADIIKLKNKVNSIKPDIIISTNYTYTVALIAGKLKYKYKIINWEHSTFHTHKSKVWNIFIKWAYKKVHCIVVLNKDEQKNFKSINSNVIVIPNFVIPSIFTSSLNNKNIITIARLEKAKGIDLLFQAASIVLQKHREWQWILIGNGNLKELFLLNIEKFGLHENILLKEATAQTVTDYVYASINVLPSRKESFGMVLIEAMNYGLPSVAFDCETGPRNIISNNEDGILVEIENPYKLADAINLLIENEEMRNRMGIAAKKNVERFYSTPIIKMWEDLFNNIMSM